MRIYLKDGQLVIRLKEEIAPYYDEYFINGCKIISGGYIENNEITDGKNTAVIFPYYTEKGELAEIHIHTSFSGKETEFYPEVEIPEKLPLRTYVFTFCYDSETDIRKACANHYNELCNTDDRFIYSNGLVIERIDGKEMTSHEIKDLREAFYKDALEWFTAAGAFFDWGIDSVYFDKKLFFWSVDESYYPYPHSLEEFKNSVLAMIECIYGDEYCWIDKEGSIDDVLEGEMWFRIVAEENGDLHAIYCLVNKQSLSVDLKELNYEDVVKICEKLVDNTYKDQMFVFHDVLPENERSRLDEWAKVKGVNRYR